MLDVDNGDEVDIRINSQACQACRCRCQGARDDIAMLLARSSRGGRRSRSGALEGKKYASLFPTTTSLHFTSRLATRDVSQLPNDSLFSATGHGLVSQLAMR